MDWTAEWYARWRKQKANVIKLKAKYYRNEYCVLYCDCYYAAV